MSRTLSDIGEYKLLETLNRSLGGIAPNVLVSGGDDAAVVRWPRGNGVVTSDCMVQDVHFRLEWTAPYQLGWKLATMNLSDISAMGGESDFAVISLAVPATTEMNFIERLYEGLQEALCEANVRLIGGDTAESESVVLTLTVIGHIPEGQAVLFSTARAGDEIYVSGQLGGSYAGLRVLQSKGNRSLHEDEALCVRRHLEPRARWREAQWIRARSRPTAMTDISDGLSRDLVKMATASKVGFSVKVDDVPVCPGAERVAKCFQEKASDWALCSGEEYELILTLPRDQGLPMKDLRSEIGLKRIGTILDMSQGMHWLNSDGSECTIKSQGFEHFSMPVE